MNKKQQILTKGRARKPGIDSSNSIKVLVQLTRGKSLREEATTFPREQPFSDPPGRQETKTIY